MKFSTALDYMRAGHKVRRKFWLGYWYWDNDKKDVVIHSKENEEFLLRETDDIYFTLKNVVANDWELASEALADCKYITVADVTAHTSNDWCINNET